MEILAGSDNSFHRFHAGVKIQDMGLAAKKRPIFAILSSTCNLYSLLKRKNNPTELQAFQNTKGNIIFHLKCADLKKAVLRFTQLLCSEMGLSEVARF